MSLSKRNFCYSILISFLFVALVAGYFAFMMPSLYVDYMDKAYVNSVIEQHKGFVETGSYENLEVKNPTGCLSIELPIQGNEIKAVGKFFQVTAVVKDKELLGLLQNFQDVLASLQEGGQKIYMEESAEEIGGKSEEISGICNRILGKMQAEDAPFDITLTFPGNQEEIYNNAKSRMHIAEDGLYIMENTIEDTENQYCTYIAIQQCGECYVFTLLPAMTPKMDEITPVVFGSLPMIGAVVILLVLLFSQIYSRGIVVPVIRLSNYVQNVKNSDIRTLAPLTNKRKDEIGMLTDELNEMYQKLRDNYLELEEKNRRLEDENKRQEVFLRASSHQLKTPVTAALLLTDGMIGKIGKYENRDEYLPQVKKQLLSMRKMIEDILSLNHGSEMLPLQEVELSDITADVLGRFWIQTVNKNLQVIQSGDGGRICTKKELLEKILDNLISNAINYTPSGERIAVRCESNVIAIENYGSHIEEELLPHIFEPFVSSVRSEKGHGLGLYVSAYYAKQLSCRISVENTERGVLTQVLFSEKLS